MVKAQLILVIIALCCLAACSQNRGPGYRFDLFKNTPNWHLAQAVESEDEKEIRVILKDSNVDINLQEPKFGVTLLHLAIGNDKLISTRVLLEKGAKLNIADSENNHAIHEATRFPQLRKNSFQILQLLIKYGADVNDLLIKVKYGNDTVAYFSPLMGASQNLACAKFLLENGANPYIKDDSTFVLWNVMLSDNTFDGIYFAKYMIVDKKMLTPNPITYSKPSNRPLDIFHFFEKENFRGDIKKEKAKQEILDYLKEIDFPNNGVYKQQ